MTAVAVRAEPALSIGPGLGSASGTARPADAAARMPARLNPGLPSVWLLTNTPDTRPAGLSGLRGDICIGRLDTAALLDAPLGAVIMLDGLTDQPTARSLCRLSRSTGHQGPRMLLTDRRGIAELSSRWGFDDFLLETASGAEIDVRIRLLTQSEDAEPDATLGALTISSHGAWLDGQALTLTFVERQLLLRLIRSPGEVLPRTQLVNDVWGDTYDGDTRKVDVQIRRLRSKLGVRHAALLQTVRKVGYRAVNPSQPGPEAATATRTATAATRPSRIRRPSRINTQAPLAFATAGTRPARRRDEHPLVCATASRARRA